MRISTPLLATPVLTAFVFLSMWSYTFGATTLTAQQNTELQYFGLTPNIDGGAEILTRLHGGCDYNPYQVLETKYKGRSGAEITPHVNSVNTGAMQGIDPALACRLTKFFDVAAAKGCNPKITYGYRSAQEQASMCGPVGGTGCLAAGKSCHQYGLAVDVTSSCIGWMRMAASQFALVFPYYGDHIQCIEHPRANYASCNRPCNGGLAITPDLSRLPEPSQVPSTYYVVPPGGSATVRDAFDTVPQSSIFSNPVGYLSQPPAISSSPAATPTTNPTTSTGNTTNQPQVCDPKFTCSGNTRTYQSSSCTTQVIQTCAAGCAPSGTDCAVSTSTAATSTTSSSTSTGINIGSGFGTDTSSNDNTNTNTAPSVSTLLNSLANTPLFSSADIGTTAPATFVLNASTGDIGQLDAGGHATSIASNTITSVQPTGPQTFTSTGFTTGYATGGAYSPQQVSGFQGILNNLKSSLLWALSVLNPFGSPAAPQPAPGTNY